jgi:hypothetical protein
MRKHRYSFAGPTKGVTDPDSIIMYNLEESDEGAILIWDGNGYNRARTWISGDEDAVFDLSEMR